jgi:hypothetical protein
MPQIAWNTFMPLHPSATFFTATVSAVLPNGPHFDRTKKKLPTPYGLFQEWAKSKLQGDWASTKMRGFFVIGVTDSSDATLLVRRFGNRGTTQLKFAQSFAHQLNYRDSSFGPLATQLGYTIK